jgi:hypothetical protein
LKPVDVFDIVKSYLVEHSDEYDGLCNGLCSCETSEFVPATDNGTNDCMTIDCMLGHKTGLDSYGLWILKPGPKKKEV